MNQIILAYCNDNAEMAINLDEQLGRIGIPFEHLSDAPGQMPGQFAGQITAASDPIVLFITDNFLRSRTCMEGLLPAFQQAIGRQKVLAVIANGNKKAEDGSLSMVPTQIDRMVNALQYMNFWQNAWLDLSTRHQEAPEHEKAAIAVELDAVRAIANQTGDLISALRDYGYISQAQLENNDYAAFFSAFGLQEWHEQYKSTLVPTQRTPMERPVEVIPAGRAEPPETDGLIAPKPDITTDPALDHADPETFRQMEALLHNFEPDLPDFEEDTTPVDKSADIAQVIRDAWFWLEKGHIRQGMDLFQAAVEEHPDDEGLQQEYRKAQAQFAVPAVEVLHGPKIQAPAAVDHKNQSGEDAHSYEQMGDLAAEKGDYLFAKYCWDRVVELAPDYPGIYHKLGLMVSEHLPDYRETALHYLQQALLQEPNDATCYLWLARNSVQNGDRTLARQQYQRAIELDPSLQNELNDQLLETPAAVVEPSPAPTETPAPEPVAEPEIIALKESIPQENAPTAPEKPKGPIVLVTGASSGIGRATAEIFARNGYRLIITGRRAERLSELKAHFEQQYQSEVLMLPFDIRQQKIVAQTIANLPESWQEIDILINNAGGAKGLAPIHEGQIEHWETMIDTNVKGLLYITRAVSPGMVQRRRGHIINLSSSAGKEAYANGAVYCATKFAVEALTRAIRLDLHRYNIRVSQVSPGHVEETEFALNRFDGDASKAKIYEDFQPLKAFDVAEAIYFMASRPAHVNIQDIWMFGTQQASATVVDRSGRN